MIENNKPECLIFEDDQSNFELLERMAQSFHLKSIKFDRLEKVFTYLELEPADLVIIDTDCVEGSPDEVTSRVKNLNPKGLVVWVCAHEPGRQNSQSGKPDIILTKPFGIMLFQQVLTPYIFSQSIPGHEGSAN